MASTVHELVTRLKSGISGPSPRQKPASEPFGGPVDELRRELAHALEEIDQRLSVLEQQLSRQR